jgi:hypothetical protein
MEFVKVNSSCIDKLKFDNNSNSLIVKFHSGDEFYLFEDVPFHEYNELVIASSVGKYFHDNIKGLYVSHKGTLVELLNKIEEKNETDEEYELLNKIEEKNETDEEYEFFSELGRKEVYNHPILTIYQVVSAFQSFGFYSKKEVATHVAFQNSASINTIELNNMTLEEYIKYCSKESIRKNALSKLTDEEKETLGLL